MTLIELCPMTTPSAEDFELLLNDPAVTRHLPLHRGYMTAEECQQWARGKSTLWADPERGPWSVYVDGRFAGWGGLQPEEGGEAGLALVLHKRHWGRGLTLARTMVMRFRSAGGYEPVVVCLPLTRRCVGTLERMGLIHLGQVTEQGVVFNKFLWH